jgi:hypothetical protein
MVAMFFVQSAGAATYNYTLGYSLEHSDNINLAQTEKRSELINVANAGFSLLEKSRELESQIVSQIEYRNYKNNTNNDESVLNFNGNATWNISPQRFSWMVEDYYTQTAINPTQANTASNRQNTNVFQTGPDLSVRLGPVNTLKFGARHGKYTYQTTDLDNVRRFAYGRWLYQSTTTTTLSLNYESEAIDYDNEILNPNFKRQDSYLRIENKLSRNTIVLDLGKTVIHRERAADVENNLGRFTWTRDLATSDSFIMSLSSELSDVGRQALVSGQQLSNAGITEKSVSADVFVAKRAEVQYTHRRSYGRNTLRLFRQKKEFELSTINNEDQKGGATDFGYDFSDAITGLAFLEYLKTDYLNTLREDKDKRYGASLVRRFSKNLSLSFGVTRNQRDSSLASAEYVENRALISLLYISNPFPVFR